MERSLDQEWRDIVARLQAMPSGSQDNAFAHWGVVAGVLAVLPLVTPQTMAIAVPFAVAAVVLGVLGFLQGRYVGRGHRRALLAMALGVVPLIALSALVTLQYA